ncbi:LuxR C-terminal-related transcriptional regulator [Streptomyces javensis]|uniref:Helix-turn-helix transcriptional regulator n=1 Tax=Streptomyces javensis TaxID=114698 RepID=A0ABS0R4E5_9ACTN|nr:LuxR C-terminal-related transcriptional regulator [Streptomyces javensis]MBI0312180.1 helix-turn-helix transcriptional regulator [Streptomyces javensis]
MDLTAAVDVIRAPLGEILPRVSAVLSEAIAHRAAAELSGNCPHSPFKTHGDPPGDPGTAITTAEMAALAPMARAEGTWQGRAWMAGAEVPVLAVHSDATARGALLVLVRTEEAPVPAEALAGVRALWDLVTAHRDRMAAEAVPGALGQSRAAAAARATAIAELVDAHGAALSALLGVLRGRDLDDRTARARAVDLAVSSLAELRARTDRDQALVEEPAGDAFARLAASLRPELRGLSVRLDLGPPGTEEGADRLLAADVANAARAVVRAVVHAMLNEQGPGQDGAPRPVHRVHIGWKVGEGELRATVRDDGPGVLRRTALDARRVGERLAALGGRLDVDAVPEWGTTVTATVPLGPPQPAREDPLDVLRARELEVLEQLARGRRNRQIAQELHISESTVKFHVANILEKLGVTSRGEAAALAHTWGATDS